MGRHSGTLSIVLVVLMLLMVGSSMLAQPVKPVSAAGGPTPQVTGARVFIGFASPDLPTTTPEPRATATLAPPATATLAPPPTATSGPRPTTPPTDTPLPTQTPVPFYTFTPTPTYTPSPTEIPSALYVAKSSGYASPPGYDVFGLLESHTGRHECVGTILLRLYNASGAVVSTSPVSPVYSWYLGQPIPFYSGGMTDWPVDHYEIAIAEKSGANCEPQVILDVTGVTKAPTATSFEVDGTVTNNTEHVVNLALVGLVFYDGADVRYVYAGTAPLPGAMYANESYPFKIVLPSYLAYLADKPVVAYAQGATSGP